MQLDVPDDQLDDPGRPSSSGWVFYSKSADNARADWPEQLQAGTINFWWHGLGHYRVGGAPYSKSMKRGDFVAMVLAEEVIATGVLAAGAEWRFVDDEGRRRWPIYIDNVLLPPIPRAKIEDGGGRIIPHAGTVAPLPPGPRAMLDGILLWLSPESSPPERDVPE